MMQSSIRWGNIKNLVLHLTCENIDMVEMGINERAFKIGKS